MCYEINAIEFMVVLRMSQTKTLKTKERILQLQVYSFFNERGERSGYDQSYCHLNCMDESRQFVLSLSAIKVKLSKNSWSSIKKRNARDAGFAR